MTDPILTLDETPEPEPACPLPIDVEHVSAYAWRRGALETIVFHGAAMLTTNAGPLRLDEGTWLLARWDGPPLPDIPYGELVCVIPDALQETSPEPCLHPQTQGEAE